MYIGVNGKNIYGAHNYTYTVFGAFAKSLINNKYMILIYVPMYINIYCRRKGKP